MSLLLFEWRKLFASRRLFIAAVTVVFYLLVLLLGFYTYAENQSGGTATFRYTFENTNYFNGLTFTLYVCHFAVLFVVPIFAAAEGATQIGAERQARTLELMLTRPLAQVHILLAKFFVAVASVGVLTTLVLTLGLLIGLFVIGLGHLDIYPGVLKLTETHQHLPQEVALWRFVCSVPVQIWTTLPVLAFGFMLGVWGRQAAASVSAAIAVYLILTVLGELHFFEALRPWFFTAYAGAWRHMLMETIPWQQLAEDCLRAAVFTFSFLACCLWRMRRLAT